LRRADFAGEQGGKVIKDKNAVLLFPSRSKEGITLGKKTPNNSNSGTIFH
jgi:hypothetical protein